MAQFRTTADILDSILRRAGEVTNGNSAFESDALEYLNRVHHDILAGGSVFNMDVDEAWTWAHAKAPIILELQPAYETGSVSVTNGSEAGTFSSAPTNSLVGWHIRINQEVEVYKIKTHVAGNTAFELDGNFVGDTAAAASFKAYKLDYEIVGQHITIDSTNNKIDFIEGSGSALVATLTAGVYSPAELATELATQLNAAGSSTYSVTYDSVTRKFTVSITTGGTIQEQVLANQSKTFYEVADTSADRRAQQFLAGSSFSFDQLEMEFSRLNSSITGNVIVEVFADNGSDAPATTALGSATIDVSEFFVGNGVGALTAFLINFDTPISVTSGSKYFLSFRTDATAISGTIFVGSSTGLAADGLVYLESTDSGATWSADDTAVSYYRSFKLRAATLKFASGSNAANSAAMPLGFDDEDQASSGSHTGLYPLHAISRMIEPFKLHRDALEPSLIMGIDKSRFEAEWSYHKAEEALPSHFTKIEEDQDGRIWVRFNSYPKEARRLEINYIPVPRDLKDNAISRVLLPRKDLAVLEYGAAFYLLLDKEDSKADVYGNLAKQGLSSMQKRNRNELREVDRRFGQIVTRPEQQRKNLRRLRYGYTAGD
jgi:hypothetical protein